MTGTTENGRHRGDVDVTELLAWAYLARVTEPPSARLLQVIDGLGPVEAARRVREGMVDSGLLRAAESRRELDLAEEDLRVAATHGARLLYPGHPEWPVELLAPWPLLRSGGNHDLVPPLALWARGSGNPRELLERSVAVVGTRAPSRYGERVAASLAADLGSAGYAIVSGGAYGIDAAAHRGALATGAPTVVFLACGIDRTYPVGHHGLFGEIADGKGLVLTEYSPGTTPGRHRFLTRNRLVAGLTAGTVVVEAGARSGAINTATWAAHAGRPVAAVPGPVTATESQGCHRLLREGTAAGPATLVTCAPEVIELVGAVGELAARPAGRRRPTDGLDLDHLRVFDALPASGPRSLGQIATDAGLPVALVRGALDGLVREGLAEAGPGWWSRRAERGGPARGAGA